MVKLVFVDMDDTFVAPDKSIPVDNLRILDVAHERGVQFVPCTGRSLRGLPQQLISHPCVRYAVCSGGALVFDLSSGEVVHREPIEKDVVRALYDDVRDQRITFDLTTDEGVVASSDCWPLYYEAALDGATRAMVIKQRTRFEGPTAELIEQSARIYRVNVLYVDDAGRQAVWDAVDARPELCRTSSIPVNVEITSVRATKGTALTWLCGNLGIPVAETVAFGDSSNDLAMIEAAGDGVAMGNASPEVKAAADHVAPPCAEAGVARYLEPMLRG